MVTLIGIWNKAVALTLTGLGLSVVGCWLALRGESQLAWSCVIATGICDLFDGLIARRIHLSEEAQAFGVQIDSLVDMAGFGVTPAVVFLASTGGADPARLAVAVLYVGCAAVRLGYFNVHGTMEEGGKRFYRGLPVTYAALFLPLGFLASCLLNEALHPFVMGTLMLVLAVLFVWDVPVPKPRGVWYILFPIMALEAMSCLFWMRFSD